MTRLVSAGTKLSVKASGASAFTQVTDVKKFPKFLGEREQVDTTCIEDKQKTSSPGQSDPGDMAFTLAFTGMESGTNWATLRALETGDTAATFKVEFPDESGFQYDAKVALSMEEVSDGNSPLEFTCTMYPQGEIKPINELSGT